MNFPNLHPHAVHFPIAGAAFLGLFALVYLLFKREGARTAMLWLLPFTALGAVAAAGTGLLYEKLFPHPHGGGLHELMELHEALGLATAGALILTSLLVWILGKRGSRSLNAILLAGALSSAGLAALTGYYGGELGHTHGLATPERAREISPETQPSNHEKNTQEPHHHEGEHSH